LEFSLGAVAPDLKDFATGSPASAMRLPILEKAQARGFCDNRINAAYAPELKGPHVIAVQ
jgi:hypothetical protein